MVGSNCFETIRLYNGVFEHIEYHNERLNHTRFKLYAQKEPLDIQEYLKEPPKSGLWRARVVYNIDIIDIEYIPYTHKNHNIFGLVEFNGDYSFKYTNRSQLNSTLKMCKNCDDVILYKDGLLTDTTIANIALYRNGVWWTPAKPLLAGTTRERLLRSGKIRAKDIEYKSINEYEKFALMNAMIGFVEIDNPQFIV